MRDIIPFPAPPMLDSKAVARVLGLDGTDLLTGAVLAGLFPPPDDDGPLWRADAVAGWLAADGMARLFAAKAAWVAATVETDRAWESGCILCGAESANVVVVRPNDADVPPSAHGVCRGHVAEIETDAWYAAVAERYAARGLDVRRPEARRAKGGGR